MTQPGTHPGLASNLASCARYLRSPWNDDGDIGTGVAP